MEIITDLGAHARFVWPAYGAFVVIFGGLLIWVRLSGARAKAELERREAARKESR
ncbi:heme exporter protein CcmD [Pikeienuella piscinae]|uniref:Heme exporter protein D n=1 Tax=Pikeienuella piscinae TaxID=2748098 RepID=A0A7L5C0W6_9RHOB|nr:heme exporter protein CcmD [Pikeienuella piscinae]QIE56417.1 heme exporter protein CcmD [Pikeienuella piscinae]